MDATPADIPSLEVGDVEDDYGFGVEASGDHDDGAESGKELMYNIPEKKFQKEKKHQAQQKEKLISEKIMNGNLTRVTIPSV